MGQTLLRQILLWWIPITLCAIWSSLSGSSSDSNTNHRFLSEKVSLPVWNTRSIPVQVHRQVLPYLTRSVPTPDIPLVLFPDTLFFCTEKFHDRRYVTSGSLGLPVKPLLKFMLFSSTFSSSPRYRQKSMLLRSWNTEKSDESLLKQSVVSVYVWTTNNCYRQYIVVFDTSRLDQNRTYTTKYLCLELHRITDLLRRWSRSVVWVIPFDTITPPLKRVYRLSI